MRQAGLVLITLLLACPLFDWPGAGFDAVRLPVVLLLTAALLATSSLWAAREGERPPGPAPLRTAGLLLLGIQLLSLVVAPRLSDAVVPILILFAGIAAYAGLRSGLVSREGAASLAPVICGIGLVVGCIGIGQQLLGREASALEGNRNYAGALSAMLLPATVAFTRTGRPPGRLLAAAASAALIALLLLSESRGGFLAAAVGLAIVGATLGAKRVSRGAAVAGAGIVLIVGLAAAFQGRRQMSAERMETAGFRLDVWRSGLRMFGSHPVLGGGAGSFSSEYPPFRSESEFRYSQKHSPEAFRELEDAHSSWVQTAVETGAAGLLSLLLVVYVSARLWRYYVRIASDGETAVLLAGLGGGAAAYLIAGMFNSLTLKTSPTLLFWMFLGLIELVGDDRPWRRPARSGEGKVAFPAAAAIVALFGALWMANLGTADSTFTEGMRSRDATVREARMREALDKNPYSSKAHYELALALSSLGRFKGAAEEARATLRLRPHHVEALNQAGICLLQSGGDAREAEALLRHAIEIAPFYYKTFHNMGVLELRQGRRAEARGHFSRAIELKPDHALAYLNRGLLNVAGGEASAALDDLRKARTLGLDVVSALRSEAPSAESDARYAEFFR